MSEPPVFIRRRVYIACLNCRKRKIKTQSGTPRARKLDEGRHEASQQAAVRPLIAFNPYPNYKHDSEQNAVHPNNRSTTPQMPGPTAASSSGSHSGSITHHRSEGIPPSSSSGLYPALPYGYSRAPAAANTHRTMHPMPRPPQQNVAPKYPGPNNNFGYHLNDWEASLQSSVRPNFTNSRPDDALVHRDPVIAAAFVNTHHDAEVGGEYRAVPHPRFLDRIFQN
ncbi:hypothetical protein FB451DRAFT_1191963 [Mycena latifolia]|nr:hypothetical protein FB451DRAFT_1191963 [Mycena latifolia]